MHEDGAGPARSRDQDRASGAGYARGARKETAPHRARRARSTAETPRPPCVCSPDLLAGQSFDSRLVGGATLSAPSDGSRDRPAAQDGREHRGRGTERNRAGENPRRQAQGSPARSARGQCAGEKRAASGRPFCQRENHGARAGGEPKSHRADAELFSRPHRPRRGWRHQHFRRSGARIARFPDSRAIFHRPRFGSWPRARSRVAICSCAARA